MDRPIVVNASPLIFLGNAGHLELLRNLQGTRILVPEVVHAEVSSGGHFDTAVRELSAANWIERVPDDWMVLFAATK
jgi:predicted nucleic acid-binding protein